MPGSRETDRVTRTQRKKTPPATHPLHIVVTAGPTREHFDPVRFLSNPSTGKMGYAIAEAAARRGHRVTLVSGPVELSPPYGTETIHVTTAAEMAKATKQAFREFYFRPKQVWRMSKMMLKTGDIGMIWDICKNFLGWIYSKKQDRVVPKEMGDAPELTETIDPNDARRALHSSPVLEAPRTNPHLAKPRHRRAKDTIKIHESE